jgi:hypothetical protein
MELLAAIWVGVIETLDRKRVYGDLVSIAKEQLKDGIKSMTAQITKSENELSELSTQIKTNRDKLSKDALKKLLVRSRRVRTCLRSDNNKLMLMEGQLETMENNEVNKTVLASLQSSAKAMQHMGLSKDLQRTDEVISELEAGMGYVQDINSTVGTTVGQLDFGLDDDSLESELNLILGIEQPQNVLTHLSQRVSVENTEQQPSLDVDICNPVTANSVANNVELTSDRIMSEQMA